MPDESPRVLIIEDDWLLATEVKSWLEEEEINVLGTAGAIAAARALAKRQPADIAIVDFNLRGESAAPLVGELCEMGVKVIVLSGYAHPCQPNGRVVSVMEKPTTKGQLVNAVNKAAHAARMN